MKGLIFRLLFMGFYIICFSVFCLTEKLICNSIIAVLKQLCHLTHDKYFIAEYQAPLLQGIISHQDATVRKCRIKIMQVTSNLLQHRR